MTNGNELSKPQVSALVAALIAFVIAVLSVFGYNVVVVQPQFAAIAETQQKTLVAVQSLAAGMGEQGLAGSGVTNFTSVDVAQNLAVGGNLDVAGTTTLADVITDTNGIVVNVPTPQATATPGVLINNTGVNEPWIIRQNATPIARVNKAGNATFAGSITGQAIYGLAPISAKSASYPVTAADSGTLFKTTNAITLTLPGAAAGLQYCVVNYDGADLVLAFTDATDVALNEVNSAGDRVTNTTAYDNICLQAIDTTNWVTLSSIGTWADGN